MKNKLLNHLITRKSKYYSIQDLWYTSKEYYSDRNMKMGGSYSSFGRDIRVRLLDNKVKITFKVSIKEVEDGVKRRERVEKLERILRRKK